MNTDSDFTSSDQDYSDRAQIDISTPIESDQNAPTSYQEAANRIHTVPYGALAEERARRKDLQRTLRELRHRETELKDRLAQFEQSVGSHPNSADPAVNYGESLSSPDPSAALERQSGEEDQTPGSPDDLQDHVNETDGLIEPYQTAVQDFSLIRPDYMEAYRHALHDRVTELMDLGYPMADAVQITNQNEREIVEMALAQGRNPAEVIYAHAARRGYRPASVIGQAPVQARVPAEAERVALAARGQAASKSLSAAGGGVSGSLSLEALAHMSDDEFAEATKGGKWERLLR